MTNTLYLDETLTGFEREIAIESAKMDISMQKLDALYEAVDANLQANYKEAELKVYAENGTYDDLAMLYMEAENDAAEKKGGILSSLFNAIVSFCGSIINGIKNIFKKSSGNKSVPQDTVLDVATEDAKKLDTAGEIVGKSTGFLHGIKSATKEGCKDFIKFVKDNIGFVVVTGTAATGAVAGTTHLITKKVTKASLEKKIADLTDQLDELRKVVGVAKLTVKAGEIFTGSDEDSGEQKPAEQPAAATDGKKSDATPAGQATPAATQTSDGKSDDGKKKGAKILDAIKTALRWIGDSIKKIGTFVSGIWNKYIGSLFKKNKNTETKDGTPTEDSGAAEDTPDGKSGKTDDAKDETGAKPEETKTESTIDFLLDLI
jgi:hypothetical protein